MATKAYILIKVKAGRTKDVLQTLKRLTGVEQAHSCFGRPDIILFISVTDERALSDVVITKIHQVEGWRKQIRTSSPIHRNIIKRF